MNCDKLTFLFKNFFPTYVLHFIETSVIILFCDIWYKGIDLFFNINLNRHNKYSFSKFNLSEYLMFSTAAPLRSLRNQKAASDSESEEDVQRTSDAEESDNVCNLKIFLIICNLIIIFLLFC